MEEHQNAQITSLDSFRFWAQVFYKNKNIILLTEKQNWRNEYSMRRTFLYFSIKKFSALNLEPTTSGGQF